MSNNPNRHIKELIQQIVKLFYKLYNLTKEEIKIIEENV